jgi:hypothetical protein
MEELKGNIWVQRLAVGRGQGRATMAVAAGVKLLYFYEH